MFRQRNWSIDELTVPMVKNEILFSGHTDLKQKFVCLYCPSFGKTTTQTTIAECKQFEIKHLCVIIGKPIRAPTRDLLIEKKMLFEIFFPHEVEYNPMISPLQPTYTVLTSQEKADFLKKKGLKEENLPKFKKNSVVARYYNWSSGTLVSCVSPSSPGWRIVQ